MRRANEELHGTLKKARKELSSARCKVVEVIMKEEAKSKIAIDRLKVSTFLLLQLYLLIILFCCRSSVLVNLKSHWQKSDLHDK